MLDALPKYLYLTRGIFVLCESDSHVHGCIDECISFLREFEELHGSQNINIDRTNRTIYCNGEKFIFQTREDSHRYADRDGFNDPYIYYIDGDKFEENVIKERQN